MRVTDHNTQHLHSRTPAARLHHNHLIHPQSDTGKLLNSAPAIHWHQIHLYWTIIHQVRRLAIAEPDGRSLHNRRTDSGSDCVRLLGSPPATQRYRIHPSATFIHEGIVLNAVLAIPELDGRLLHNRCRDVDSVCGRLLGLMPAIQRYKVRLYRINTQEITQSCEICLYNIGTLAIAVLDCRFLHNYRSDTESDCRGLLGPIPATQQYRIHPPMIFIHEVTWLNRVLVLLELDG